MSQYPDRHHPVFFLISALQDIGIGAEFARDERTLGCWGMVFPDFDNRVLVWLIDNRLPHEQAKEDPAAVELLLTTNAIVCHAQKPDAERRGGYWLPLAATPGFENIPMIKTHDVAFVGFVRDEGRARLLAGVGAKFDLNLQQGVFGEKATETYCTARVGLNIVSHYGQPYAYDSANMRLFEILMCGIPLVTPYQPYLEKLGLIDRENYVAYHDEGDLCEAVQFALDHPHISRAGWELVKKRHLYSHRAETIKQCLMNEQ